jgi:hypothetical protein
MALDADSRVLTEADVREAVTLAEPDLFRTLQRLPGVAARDDYTAALGTRGAPWDQTQVSFDGLPLFNPLHAAGLVSAVNTDALGAVAFHPGVQPTEHAGGAAALVGLRDPGEYARQGSSAIADRLAVTRRKYEIAPVAGGDTRRRLSLGFRTAEIPRLGGGTTRGSRRASSPTTTCSTPAARRRGGRRRRRTTS